VLGVIYVVSLIRTEIIGSSIWPRNGLEILTATDNVQADAETGSFMARANDDQVEEREEMMSTARPH